MMDPFSIVVGTVSLTSALLKVARTTEDFVKGIKGAPQAVKSLSDEVSGLHKLLKDIDVLFGSGQEQNDTLVRLKPVLRPHFENCKKSLDDVDEGLRPFVKSIDGSVNVSKWRALKWKYREKDVITLRNNLHFSQANLILAVQTVNLSSQMMEFGTVKNTMKKGFKPDVASFANSSFIGSDEPVSEYGFALKRYLLDTGTVPEDNALSTSSKNNPIALNSPVQSVQDTLSDDKDDRDDASSSDSSMSGIREPPDDLVAPPALVTQLQLSERLPDALPTEMVTQLERNENQQSTFEDKESISIARSWASCYSPMPLPLGVDSSAFCQVPKDYVSREALLQTGYTYIEEGNFIRLSIPIDGSKLAHLSMTSMRISRDKRTWWPAITTSSGHPADTLDKTEFDPLMNIDPTKLAGFNRWNQRILPRRTPLSFTKVMPPSPKTIDRTSNTTPPPPSPLLFRHRPTSTTTAHIGQSADDSVPNTGHYVPTEPSSSSPETFASSESRIEDIEELPNTPPPDTKISNSISPRAPIDLYRSFPPPSLLSPNIIAPNRLAA